MIVGSVLTKTEENGHNTITADSPGFLRVLDSAISRSVYLTDITDMESKREYKELEK